MYSELSSCGDSSKTADTARPANHPPQPSRRRPARIHGCRLIKAFCVSEPQPCSSAGSFGPTLLSWLSSAASGPHAWFLHSRSFSRAGPRKSVLISMRNASRNVTLVVYPGLRDNRRPARSGSTRPENIHVTVPNSEVETRRLRIPWKLGQSDYEPRNSTGTSHTTRSAHLSHRHSDRTRQPRFLFRDATTPARPKT